MDATANDVLAEAEIDRLKTIRNRLLHLHKVLLDRERQEYEKVAGRVTAGELLQLVLNHPQFAWLRMISALIVEIDEALNGEDPLRQQDFANLVRQARLLLTSSESEEFKTRYQAALQREPDVVLAHSAVMQLLRLDD